jgi:protein tyrosine/serine phosphatase
MAGAFKTRMLALQQRLTETYGTDISTPAARRAAWWHFQLIDHAFLRVLWSNLGQIAPGVWRSNQPSADQLRRYHAKLGLKSVLCLRGSPQQAFFLFEAETCKALNLPLYDIGLSARRAPERAALLKLLDLFHTIPKPVLIHCKSGADRTGLAAALYLLDVEKRPLAEAKEQLSFRYLHLKSTATGVMDEFLSMYEDEGGGKSVRDWIAQDYVPKALTRRFAAKRGRA